MFKNFKRANNVLKLQPKTQSQLSNPSSKVVLSSSSSLNKFSSTEKKKTETATMNGSEATARVAYALSEQAYIYPITPSSLMPEYFDNWGL